MMKRFENLIYLFAGFALGMLIAASLYEKEVQKIHDIIYLPKTNDITDHLDDSERGYYEHLIRTK
jgi:hypothetical protein